MPRTPADPRWHTCHIRLESPCARQSRQPRLVSPCAPSPRPTADHTSIRVPPPSYFKASAPLEPCRLRTASTRNPREDSADSTLGSTPIARSVSRRSLVRCMYMEGGHVRLVSDFGVPAWPQPLYPPTPCTPRTRHGDATQSPTTHGWTSAAEKARLARQPRFLAMQRNPTHSPRHRARGDGDRA